MGVNLVIVVALILLNGLFALAELAVVSSRRARLQALADRNRRGAQSALALHADPGRFLSSVQIGITLVGIVNGAFSGEAFGDAAADALVALGLNAATAATLGYTAIILAVTYLSVIVGELVPKSLALRNPEGIACAVAPAMTLFARLAAPAVWILDASTRLIMRLIGQGGAEEPRVTDEEIKSLIAQAEQAGVVETDERDMIASVMRLADRRATSLMTPRMEIEWIDMSDPPADIAEQLKTTRQTFLPAAGDSLDHVEGVVRTREALLALLDGKAPDLEALLHRVDSVPESAAALDVVTRLREAPTPVVFVRDERGHFEGLITSTDILESIAGAFVSESGPTEPDVVARDDGTYLMNGAMPADEAAELLGILLPDRRSYETLAGLMLDRLGRLPDTGEAIEADGWRLEVIDMDGQRIDKLLARRTATTRRAGKGTEA
ncbi:MAG: HlyC/CorC family transporter [Roseitalea sp.]|jgi:putative hemolysin|uniref:hemolysin family protein n=1 Tax=Oceaniradius stylonematis TaxID=2184161 RepID=UPI000F3BC971|nr:HlyC/CorC family transporter [Roseitalea sp.]MBO6953014.1 HlyC/CorC family transporter [Rhizobiaceae bacterium]RNC96558.1 MAG: HlyC/CorC family transporter [Oricola sp.]MBO6593361.1 HlyC/CorC family transporter [Roseitalea sp.]MBO6600649.1 HlyC/CorC family transporter [Roseitalea sp.]